MPVCLCVYPYMRVYFGQEGQWARERIHRGKESSGTQCRILQCYTHKEKSHFWLISKDSNGNFQNMFEETTCISNALEKEYFYTVDFDQLGIFFPGQEQ